MPTRVRASKGKRNLCVTLHAVTRPTRTGAERYFAERAEEPGFTDAYNQARRRIDQIDRLVLALDEHRETLGMTKAELARRADLAPEAIRRLFSTDSPNPTIGTLAAVADALDLELVTRRRRIRLATEVAYRSATAASATSCSSSKPSRASSHALL